MNITIKSNLGQLIKELDLYANDIQFLPQELAVEIRYAILERIISHFGDDSEHLSVEIGSTGSTGISVLVKINDEVGRYMIFGVEPHEIYSDIPMPFGDGQFAMSASHPGYEGKEEILMEAIREGYSAVMGSKII